MLATDLSSQSNLPPTNQDHGGESLMKQADHEMRSALDLLKGLQSFEHNSSDLNLPKYLASFNHDQESASSRPADLTWQQFVDHDINAFKSTPSTISGDLNDLQSKTSLLEFQMIDHMARSELFSRLFHPEQPDWADSDMNNNVMNRCHQLEGHVEYLNTQISGLSSELSENIREFKHAETSLSHSLSQLSEKLNTYYSTPDPATLITDAELKEQANTLRDLNEVLAREQAELDELLPLESTRLAEIAHLEQESKCLQQENARLAEQAQHERDKVKQLEAQMAGMDPKVPVAVEARKLMLAAQLRVAGATNVTPIHDGADLTTNLTHNALMHAIFPDRHDWNDRPKSSSPVVVVDLMSGTNNRSSISRHLVVQQSPTHASELLVHLMEVPQYQADPVAVIVGTMIRAKQNFDYDPALDRMHSIYLTPLSIGENVVPPLSALHPRIAASTRFDNLVLAIQATDDYVCQIVDQRLSNCANHPLSLPNGYWQVSISKNKNRNAANSDTNIFKPEVILVVCADTGNIVKYGVKGIAWTPDMQDLATQTQPQLMSGSHEGVLALLEVTLL